MKKTLFGLLILGTLSAQASTFEDLDDVFEKGTLPNLDSISNIAFSGRCFLATQPNDPISAVYVLRKKLDAQPTQSYDAITYRNYGAAPDLYDNMSIVDLLKVLRTKVPFEEAIIDTDRIEILLGFGEISQLKVSGQYLVENLFGEGSKVHTRCYYPIPEIND